MWQVSENVVYVEGAINAAIYNLNSGEVFSLNSDASKIVKKFILSQKMTRVEQEFLETLDSMEVIDLKNHYICREYSPTYIEKDLDLVWLEITQSCNMHCLHCYEGKNHVANKNVLSLNEWKKVISEVIDLKPRRIVIIGGEPCVHKDIILMIKYIRELDDKISVTLFTNGYFLDGRLVDIIIENKIEVKVSLYGHCAEVHDGITGISGSFDKLVNAITVLKRNNIPINIAVTLMKENENYYEQIKEFVSGLEVRGCKFDVIREVIDGTQSNHKPMLESVIEKAYRTKPNFYVKKNEFDSNYYFNSCWKGKIVITETGDILPCVFARNHVCGNVREQSIESIIRKKGDSNLCKFWSKSLQEIEVCRDCEYRFACKDCRALAESTYDIKKKNPRCTYNPYNGRWGER